MREFRHGVDFTYWCGHHKLRAAYGTRCSMGTTPGPRLRFMAMGSGEYASLGPPVKLKIN